jgi:cytochrome c-type biogenesis protein CcmH/NrfG
MKTSAVVIAVLIVAGTLLWCNSAISSRRSAIERAHVGSAATLSTSRESLVVLVARLRARVAGNPGDGEAAVLLADALMRLARVDSDASLPLEAEKAVRAAITHDPNDYPSRRMLGVVLLAQHRFAPALEAAREAQRSRPHDPWNFAVAGDALLELGRYEEAFIAFDELNKRRPDATAYARAAYARELQGDHASARTFMQMAADGTGAHDPEGQAWYLSQLGHLFLLDGRLDEAERSFKRAEFTFPGHPYTRTGLARVLVARSRLRDAYSLLASGHDTPETWALRGDIARRVGDAAATKRAYAEAERLEREGWRQEEPQPAALARFFAERGMNTAEAVQLAERAATTRRDIHTMDALAWSYFRAGQLDRATQAMAAATRTGTRDPRVRCHADAIASARAAAAAPPQELCDPLDTIAPTPTATAATQIH